MAKRYSKQAITDEASYQRKLKITQQYLRPEMEVLEIGCGTGSTAIIHAPCVKHIRAVDLSSKMLEIAQDKANAKNIQNIRFEQSSAEELEGTDHSVDAVLCLSILHLLENKEVLIKKIYGMLKPGCKFFSSTACLQDDLRWLKMILPLGKLVGLVPPVTFFTRKELETCLRDAGFAIEESWSPGKAKAVFIVAKKPVRS
ncbi:methyltransferase domain-containing protein [Candidatus Haliotispira prima]|uniref:Methyltransferase domain-containing protein n=1 Tax=Candidatus Haliotispira prima TaxID=3034016 RepID=A0ABY8MKA9_9SPIO|nr:methyltransferase domain-containing protein [Candidatus Haliotispira prima]